MGSLWPTNQSSEGFSETEARPVGSYADTGINVLVVGTGLAGLTAALECRRKGHSVVVLERNATINTAGDMYFMGLSATRFLKHWPEMLKEYKQISLSDAYIETYKHSGECVIPALRVADRLRENGLDPDTPPGTFQMRPLVYKMFVDQLERLGIPVHYNQKIVDYEEDASAKIAYAISQDGKRYQADVIIAADGVGSKSQRLVGGQVRAIPSGRAMWRAAFPIENLDKNPHVKEFFRMHEDRYPIVRTWLGPGTYALTLTRPDTMIWIVNHDAGETSKESWNDFVDVEEVLEGMKNMFPSSIPGWAREFQDLVKCTPPKTIVNFELLWRNPQPSWVSPAGRVIQIGDAAHSFLPASGNGATQAIEDAISIASCLHIGGKEKIPDSVRVHMRFRFIRTACAQKIGFANAELLQDTDWDKVKIEPRRAQPLLPAWIFSHDPEIHAYKYYERSVDSMKKGIRVEDDDQVPPNYPPGYRFKPWDIETIMKDMRDGKGCDLGEGKWF